MKITLIFLCVAYCLLYSQAEIELINGRYPNENLGLVSFANLTNKYYFSKENETFIDASNFCLMYGMDLAKLESQFESDTLLAHINSLQPYHGYYRIAGQKLGIDQWLWIDGTPFTFTSWGNGQPTYNNLENCLMINKGLKGWQPTSCKFSVYFICKTRLEEI